MAKILFFNPPSRELVYLNTNVKVGAPSYPNLTLAALAGGLSKNHQIKIIDLDLPPYSEENLFAEIINFKPEVVASSAKTTDYLIVKEIMRRIKNQFPQIRTIVGGVHITACPEEAVKEAGFDILVLGEGDNTIAEILSSSSLINVSGIIYKNEQGEAITTNKRELIKDINELPYPAWEFFDIKRYKNSRLSSRKNPVSHIETSRGCPYQCNYCSKLTFGTKYRAKHPKRVVDEMEYMLKAGFSEIHIADDSFTQDINRAKEICVEILRRGIKFPWSLINGVRVNNVDSEFLQLAKKAGLWQIGFGIESGDQNVLNKINKRITLAQVEKAVKLSKKVGIDTFGFFIFGLSGETEESMRLTIEFAKKLPLDIAKFDICIPYPGTKYYDELNQQGRIKTKDWSKYLCHQTADPLFEHPNLAWKTIEYFYHKAFREFYLRPAYMTRRFIRSLRRGDLIYDAIYFLNSKW